MVLIRGSDVIEETKTDDKGVFTSAVTWTPDLWAQASADGMLSSAPVALPSDAMAPLILELRPTPWAASTGEAGRIMGRVRDEAGRPIPDVSVMVGGRLMSTTGGSGGFDFAWSTGPDVALRFEHLGYDATEKTVSLRNGGGIFLDVQLSTLAVELPEIRVQVIAERQMADLSRLRQSVRMGGGEFITDEQFAQKGYPSMRYVFATIRGMEFNAAGMPIFRRTDCTPTFWVDGMKMSSWQSVSDLQTLDIDLIESYRGPAAVPPQFVDSDSRCGVIAIWTKRGANPPLSAVVDALRARRSGG